jgi:hypothetical protein
MIVYIYNIGVDLYNGFNGLRHRINWTYFTVLDGLAHPLYSAKLTPATLAKLSKQETVSMDTLIRLCDCLDCTFDDVVELIKD